MKKAKKSKAKKTIGVAGKRAKTFPRKKAAPKKPKLGKRGGKFFDVVNVKLSHDIRSTLRARAKKFAKGNLSAWLRYAGLKYIPKKGEKVSVPA